MIEKHVRNAIVRVLGNYPSSEEIEEHHEYLVKIVKSNLTPELAKSLDSKISKELEKYR